MAIRIPIISDYYDGGVQKAQKSFKELGKEAMLSAASFAAVGAFLQKATKAAIEDEKSQALLARQLKISTGATGEQVQAVEDSIEKMMYQSAVADDELRPALANLVRATDNATKAQNLLTLALDISAATGKPLETISVALSKAYLGQTTALKRLGIPLDEAAVKAGDFTKIQEQLNRTFGGAAAAAANTTEGQLKQLAIAYDELVETIGAKLLPALKRIADVGIPAVRRLSDAFDVLAKSVEGAQAEQGFWEKVFKKSVQQAFDVTGGFLARITFLRQESQKTQGSLINVFEGATNLVRNAGQNFRDLYLPALEEAAKSSTKVADKTKEMRKSIKDAFKNATEDAKNYLDRAIEIRDAFASTIAGAIRSAVDFGSIKASAKEAGTTFMAGLAESVAKAKVFAERLQQLLRAGLSQSALSQVAAAGADAGTAIADELLAGGAARIGQANDLVAAAEAAAQATGTLAGATYYNEGVVLAQQLTQGITDIISKYKIKLSSPGLTEKQLNRLRNRFAIDVDFMMGKVPALADGGIVRSPTLALIGEAGPEAVVPLDRGGAMGNVTINVNGGDPNAVVDALRTYMRQNGAVPIRITNP